MAQSTQSQSLPEMGGAGWVRDLREAMSLGTPQGDALAAKVQEFKNAGTRDAQTTVLDDLLRLWAETNQTAGVPAGNDWSRRFVVNGDVTTSARLQWCKLLIDEKSAEADNEAVWQVAA